MLNLRPLATLTLVLAISGLVTFGYLHLPAQALARPGDAISQASLSD